MSDIQRYGGYDPRVVDEGPWVTYAAHVAAVAAARAKMAKGLAWWEEQVAAAQVEGENYAARVLSASNYKQGVKDGVKAARDAVAALPHPCSRVDGLSLISRVMALAAIDALLEDR